MDALGETPGLLDCLFCFCFQKYTEFVPSAPWGQPSPLCPCLDGLLAQKPGPVSHASKEKDETWRGESAFSLSRGITCVAVAERQVSSTRGQERAGLQVGLAAEDSGPTEQGNGAPTAYFLSLGSASSSPPSTATEHPWRPASLTCCIWTGVTLGPYICLHSPRPTGTVKYIFLPSAVVRCENAERARGLPRAAHSHVVVPGFIPTSGTRWLLSVSSLWCEA